MKRGFTRDEAAVYVGVSVYKVREAIRDGFLPAKRHGKDVLVMKEDLDDWLDRMDVA